MQVGLSYASFALQKKEKKKKKKTTTTTKRREEANCAPSVRVQTARINTIAQVTLAPRPHPVELVKSAIEPACLLASLVSYGFVSTTSVIYSVSLRSSTVVVRLWKLALSQASQERRHLVPLTYLLRPV